MSLPFTFAPGTVARSSQVNSNLNTLDTRTEFLSDQQYKFVLRTGITGYDVTSDAVPTGVENEFDMSGFVPSNAIAVLVYASVWAGSTNLNQWHVQAKGVSNEYQGSAQMTTGGLANLRAVGDFLIPLGAERILQYFATLGTAHIRLVVKGWIVPMN